VGRATTAMRGAGRAARERGDVARAAEELEAQREKLLALEHEFEEDLEEVREAYDPATLELESLAIRARKSDSSVGRIALVWTPWRVGPDGIAVPLTQT